MIGRPPDTELYQLLKRFQSGEAEAIWLFAQNRKIQAIINGRLKDYRQMFHWLPDEDMADIEFGLIPRIHEIATTFELSEQANDGRIIAYFNLRLRGEADFLLKKITGMKLAVDEEQGKTYLKSIQQSSDGLEEILPADGEFVEQLISEIEIERQDVLLRELLGEIPPESSDRIWLKCFMLRMRQKAWSDIGKEIGYRQTDYAWLKENTARFVTRLKHKLLNMGERVNFRICGIYTDSGEVAIALLDSDEKKKNIIWSKTYDAYADLDKIEAKLGDIFRQFDVTYVVMNEVNIENHAYIIIMRYLTKRESFVETIDLPLFRAMLSSMPESVNGIASSDSHKSALLLAHVKRAWVDESRQAGRN